MAETEETMPKWDVALAALAADEFRRKGAPLTLENFRELATQHAIRLDDIMETLFLLAIHGEWRYADSDGRERVLDQQTLDRLYVKRRLSQQDLAEFNGTWRPA
jgi:hypothetical protein